MGARHHLSRGVADISTHSLVCGLVLFGVLTGALLAPGLAAADPAPLWSDPVTTTGWAAYGAGGREAMYVNALQLGTLDTERVIGPDGAIEYQAETGNTTITPPALAADGSGYVLRGGGAAGVIDAIDTAGKVRWSYVVPAENTVRALLAGNDGAAYVVVSNAIDEEVLRLSAVDGSVTFDTPLPDGNYSAGYLFAEPTGVAAISGSHVLFLSQQGQITADVAAIPSGSATWFTSNTAGDVFVGTASAGGGQVNTAGGIAVSKVDPMGQVDWITQTPANNGGGQSTGLAALPDGGVAYEVAGQSIGVLNPDGTIRWRTESQHGYGPMLTDSADHIDFERFSGNQNCSDGLGNCVGFGIDQLEASNGQVLHSLSLVYTNNDPSQFFFCEGFSLGSGLFYVVDRLSPGDGATCNNGLTQLQLQAFALPGTTGPYPSPPATTIPATAGTGSGGGTTGPGALSGGGSQSGGNVTHNLPIVMVPGINSETEETGPKTKPSCPTKEPFAEMCSVLRAQGYPVFVVSSSKGPSTTTLNSWGDIPTNALALAKYLRAKVPRAPLVVAHSMGGLISRVALIHYHAAGLFTVGTPYDGTFWADWDADFVDVCSVLRLAIKKVTCGAIESHLRPDWPVGTEAAAELSKGERARESALLPAPTYPLWTVAGTPLSLPSIVGMALFGANVGYYFPNDLVVGETSAWGVHAGLGPTCPEQLAGIVTGCDHRLSVPAYHVWKSPGETSDPEVITDVIDVAGMLESQSPPTATTAAVHSSAHLSSPIAVVAASANTKSPRKRAHERPSVRVITLTAVSGGIARTPHAVSISAQGAVVSDHPFTVSCGGKTWEAESIAPGVWAMFGGALQCAVVARIPAGAGYLSAAVTPRTSIRLTATTRHQDVTVRVSGPGQLSATLSRPGRQPIQLRRKHGAWQATVISKRKEAATITVVSGHQVLRGTLTL